jgi:phosphorylcholine metabolism protein LicD
MKVPYSYYEDEVRDGFYVSGLMKRAWAASIEVYEVVANICNKHHIQYFADSGTLLGAFRHKGFIPWDDDIDLCMKRDDYNRFLTVVKKELPQGYQMSSLYTDPDYNEIFIRIINRDRITFIEAELNKSHGFPFVVGIDIFPLDYLSPSEEEERTRCEMVKMIYNIIGMLEQLTAIEVEESIKSVEEMCGISIDRNGHIKNQLFLLMERLFMLYHESEATELALMPLWTTRQILKFKKEYYQHTIMVPFEYIEVPVPEKYEILVKERYPNYYRKIPDAYSFHSYPFYQEQMDRLKEKAEVIYPHYVFSEQDLCRSNPDINYKVVDSNTKVRQEVVFLPYKRNKWESLEVLWKMFIQDDRYDVYVIPIPYYNKNPNRSIHEEHYEHDLYPDYVAVTYYEDYAFLERQPEMIFIHNPYDEYNSAISVHPFFYSNNLQKFTKNLIYLPYFVLEDRFLRSLKMHYMMKYFITMPGVVRADFIILQSEEMRKAYIEYLTEFAGANTRKIWQDKILVSGSPEMEKVLFGRFLQ